MPTACFYNFSKYPFTGSWNNEHQTFEAGSRTFMPAFLAQHFAKHLVNRELHRMGLDHATSPKVPEDVPEFNKLFRTAYIRERNIPGQKRSTLKDLIDSVNLNMQPHEIAGLDKAPADIPVKDVVETVTPRFVSEKEDPNYLPENAEGGQPDGAPGATAPQMVEVPDDGEDEEDGYEGTPVPGSPAGGN